MSIIEMDGGEPIYEFKGEFEFLSNFYPSVVSYEGFIFPTVEHAYQAAKNPTNANLRRFAIEIETPGNAKRIGRSNLIRGDWHADKINVMGSLLRQKFKHPELCDKLLSTGDRLLMEGNWWGDRFWGVSPVFSDSGHAAVHGQNQLGKLLMLIREELR